VVARRRLIERSQCSAALVQAVTFAGLSENWPMSYRRLTTFRKVLGDLLLQSYRILRELRIDRSIKKNQAVTTRVLCFIGSLLRVSEAIGNKSAREWRKKMQHLGALWRRRGLSLQCCYFFPLR